ncbi:MAG: TolC family protein [Gemmatimonadetes bacterium]|nr:TolC family protein [Gemmatimonadota bacterium]
MIRPAPLVGAAVGCLLVGTTAAGPARAQLPDTLDVNRAVEIALGNSPALSIARSQANVAGLSRRQALTDFLPAASASMSFNRSTFTRTTYQAAVGETEVLSEPLESGSQSASQGLNFSWTLFDARRFTNLERAAADLRAAQRGLDDRQASVAAAVKRQFYTALRRQEQLRLASEQVSDRQRELGVTQRRYEIAAVSRLDVLSAESNLLRARVDVATATAQFEQSLTALATLLGLTPEQGLSVHLSDTGEMPAFDPTAAEALVREALTGDPELLQLQARLAAASADSWTARSRYLPIISAGFSMGRGQSFELGSPFFQFTPDDLSSGFSLSASWQLFDGFTRETELARAGQMRAQARDRLFQRRLEIEQEVRATVGQIAQVSGTLELARRSAQIARQRLDMTRELYQNGTVDFTRLQQAVDQVTTAELQLLNLRFDYLIAWGDLSQYGTVARNTVPVSARQP